MQRVYIVLATYQGAAYLRPLLESIRSQSEPGWTLLARDDGSADATLEILRQAAAEDSRIVVLESDGQRRGPAANFGLLMQRAFDLGAEYLFFADQDDAWLPGKVEEQLRRMQSREEEAGKRVAHLVYSDLVVANEQMRILHPSFLAYSRLRHGMERPLRTLLGRSFVLGCACVINRPLMELALPLPQCIASHDWWVALSAAAAGRISHLPEPTLWYRRHGGNSSGPAGFWAGFNPLRHSWKRRWEIGLKSFRQSVAQALALRERLRERGVELDEEIGGPLEGFCRIFEEPRPGLRRIGDLRRLGIPAIDLPRRLLYYLCVLGSPRSTWTLAPAANEGH